MIYVDDDQFGYQARIECDGCVAQSDISTIREMLSGIHKIIPGAVASFADIYTFMPEYELYVVLEKPLSSRLERSIREIILSIFPRPAEVRISEFGRFYGD